MNRQLKPTRWMDNAACIGADLDLFYPHDSLPPVEAKAICSTCPVRDACLTYAQTNDEKHGIWGGLTYEERKAQR